ncbi:MAG: hypothetical protein O6761_08775 [Thaumarchaeota archaeon]|nr:MAG: hypothetical protein NPMRIOTA_50048 [Nitrosopumilales archaeon]MCZ6583241.1 hypothetical protein [Nitrososphaerota archaeon]GFN39550.1 MAG: conserved hypothetical protein [Marine Group I thaumarchaeote]
MSTVKPTESKDIYAVSRQNVERFFDGVEKATPKNLQSITNLQQEYLEAWKNAINSTITLQREYANRSGLNTNVPQASLKVINDTTEEAIKAFSVQNQIALAAIDATQQNVKTFNDNAKAFADLNKNILQSWISAFTQFRN